MYFKRPKKASSFGPDGKRIAPPVSSSCGLFKKSTNKLFTNGNVIKVQRAPIMCGLSVVTQKKFQRPMTKRRAYDENAENALKLASLGSKRRLNGMQKIFARAGKGLSYKSPRMLKKELTQESDSGSEKEEEEEKEDERPFEPLLLWKSPHQGGEAIGLPAKTITETRTDEFGVEETVSVLRPAPIAAYSKEDVYCPPILAKWLRPHQREGVTFLYECVMGLKEFDGRGCILADDMGLGKTLQSVTLIYTLLKTSITRKKEPTAKRVVVVCPCSLVKNWENEFVKWLGPGGVKTLAIAEADRKTVETNLDSFVKTSLFQILICSYECLRAHVGRLTKYDHCCDLLVCDEAHRLKNKDNQTSQALNSLPVRRRVLLTGTPMQNDLQEFYAMVDFTNPGILGTQEEFRRTILLPILRGREPDATDKERQRMMQLQNDMSTTVNEFILRRINTLNAQHLPPKLVQVVCCNLTSIQQEMYQHLVNSKDIHHVLNGKQVNCLGSIQMLMKLCNHPTLVADDDPSSGGSSGGKSGRRAAAKNIRYTDDDKEPAAPGAAGISKFLPFYESGRNATNIHPEWSGKMFVLYRLMREMRRPGNGNDKIVIVSNYTQTLDLIGKMCRSNSWGFCRLDGSISMKKRQKMVDEFNDPSSSLIAFLLSSKAGGCGLNLIGGNRLVLFDPDWNPAVDKQAAARCWRDGQKKRCFTYRFLATGTVEEKIFQRQLSKEGLQSVVDDKEQVNALSTKDLRNLFKLRTGTPSDTHDKLKCERCKIIQDTAEIEAMKVLPRKLAACKELVALMMQQEDASFFDKPLVPTDHDVSIEDYERLVKQPMDLGTVSNRLAKIETAEESYYKNISGVSKDVNRIFSNVMKVWTGNAEIANAARRLQQWWIDQWTELVPRLMTMKADDDGGANDDNDKTNGCNGPDNDSGDGVPAALDEDNERGDDYQEQIGMPDEENMRHWSHHYTADTVDDPIFRAAMRGTDAVSFVFGLEVTWSLIQQRQQEEEERLAMKELETIQELEGEEEDEQEGGDDADEGVENDNDIDKKPAPKRQKKETENKVEIVADDEVEDENKGDENEEEAEESDVGEDEEEDDDDEEEEAEGEDDEDEDDNEEEEEDSDEVEMEDSNQSSIPSTPRSTPPGVTTDSSSQGGTQKNNVTPSPGEWSCPGCSKHNEKSARKCVSCGQRRPNKRSIGQLS